MRANRFPEPWFLGYYILATITQCVGTAILGVVLLPFWAGESLDWWFFSSSGLVAIGVVCLAILKHFRFQDWGSYSGRDEDRYMKLALLTVCLLPFVAGSVGWIVYGFGGGLICAAVGVAIGIPSGYVTGALDTIPSSITNKGCVLLIYFLLLGLLIISLLEARAKVIKLREQQPKVGVVVETG